MKSAWHLEKKLLMSRYLGLSRRRKLKDWGKWVQKGTSKPGRELSYFPFLLSTHTINQRWTLVLSTGSKCNFGQPGVRGGRLGYFQQNKHFWLVFQLSNSRQKSHLKRISKAERKPPLRCRPVPPSASGTGLGLMEEHCVFRPPGWGSGCLLDSAQSSRLAPSVCGTCHHVLRFFVSVQLVAPHRLISFLIHLCAFVLFCFGF